MFYNSSGEYNDCTAKGACSISPDISSLQEVMILLLKQLAFYIINSKSLGIVNQNTINLFIKKIPYLDTIKDLPEANILDIFSNIYNELINCKNEYKLYCKENNIKSKTLKNIIKLTPDTCITNLLKLGETEFQNKYSKIGTDKKFLLEILISVLKSTAVNLINLQEMSDDCCIASDLIISGFNLLNLHVSSANIKKFTDRLAQCDMELLSQIHKLRIENYGEIEETTVSCSTTPNKAILVSGDNLTDLSALLKYCKNTDIEIYTNGNLIISHIYPYFKSFKNLKGHFGNDIINTMLDFATFPGAILLTKNEAHNIEYLYRGRLFTTDEYAPKGVTKLKNNNFYEIINSSKQAKGFAKGQIRPDKIVGINYNILSENLDKYLALKPEKIYIIGLSELRSDNIAYIKNKLSEISDNSLIISFSYKPDFKNLIHINTGYDYALAYSLLEKIFEKIPINSKNLYFYFTKCSINSISNIINLKNSGAKNIYLSDCLPTVINPSVLKVFRKLYNINN